MNEQIKLVVLGDPKAQQRHRAVRMGNHIRQYEPSAAHKADFLSIVQNNAPDVPFSTPLNVDITFYFSRPKGHFGTGSKLNVLKPQAPLLHISKPDLDNLNKGVFDALNKVFWKDDSIICSGTFKKEYSERPRTEITITVL